MRRAARRGRGVPFRRGRGSRAPCGGGGGGASRAGAQAPESRLPHPPALGPHAWIPRSDLHAVGARPREAARGVRSGGSALDDGPRPCGVGGGHRGADEGCGGQSCGRGAGGRARDPARIRVPGRASDDHVVRGGARDVAGGVRLPHRGRRSDDGDFGGHDGDGGGGAGVRRVRRAGARGVRGRRVRRAGAGLAGVPWFVPHLDDGPGAHRRGGTSGPADPGAPAPVEGPQEGGDPRRRGASRVERAVVLGRDLEVY